MKRLLPLCHGWFSALAALALASPATAAEPTIEDLHRSASKAFESGDVATAEAVSRRVLTAVPNHIPTLDLVTRINDSKKAAARQAIKPELAAVNLDKVKFDGESFRDAVGVIRRKLGEKQVPVNILIMDPTGKLHESEVSAIDLNNIPATSALEYLAEGANAKVVYRADSVVISPK
ncbi:MAG: hypothetical protein ACKO2G_01970 [Verrucomicrobiales bacterium]